MECTLLYKYKIFSTLVHSQKYKVKLRWKMLIKFNLILPKIFAKIEYIKMVYENNIW